MNWLLYEDAAAARGCSAVCGIDEAGRGPLAGPVFAAAVILPRGLVIEGVNDSKKLSEKRREKLFEIICGQALAFSVASADEEEIDRLNILHATFLAMKRAAEGLSIKPDFALIDGNRAPEFFCPSLCIVGGDGKSESVAAASILAKVSRDRYMRTLDAEFPQYGFLRHKGYPTKEHYINLLKYGPSKVHRKTFLRNLDEKRSLLESV